MSRFGVSSISREKKVMSAKVIASCAFLAAISIVMARLLSFSTPDGVRWSLDKFPLFLAGMLFGPMVGAMTGFVADFIGSLMQFGFNPFLCPPAILYGLFGGLFRLYLAKNCSPLRLGIAYAFPIVIGSILYQSCALAYFFFDEGFAAGLVYYLSTRTFQFSIMLVVEVLILLSLMKANVFTRLGLWPPSSLKQSTADPSTNISERRQTTMMTATEAIEYIHSVCWKGSIPGLGRTQELLRLMGNPEKGLKYVHIAGTNGKGSTAAMTASILRKAGYCVGLYTSPYIYRFNERMQVDGEEITDIELAEITEYVKPLASSMQESPTEFELVSCIGFEFFKRRKCDIVVLEVGMGGAMDSTNVIECPEVAVITNIGLDHTEVLGDTVEKIAETKSGIFKEGGHAVVYRGSEGVEAVFERVCAERNVTLRKADFDGLRSVSHSLDGQVFDCGERKNIVLPLLGDHQLHNAAVVLGIADSLIEQGWKITEQNIYDGIRDVRWPGRFDIMRRDPLFIIDGGHNPQCIEALVKNIQDYLVGRRLIVLTGVLADKDYVDMYQPVMPYVEEFVCITPPNPRRMMATQLAEYLRETGKPAEGYEEIIDGVRAAIEKAGKDGVVLSFGSLYSIGSIRDALDAL